MLMGEKGRRVDGREGEREIRDDAGPGGGEKGRRWEEVGGGRGERAALMMLGETEGGRRRGRGDREEMGLC